MRILLISPSFFGYEKTVADAFRSAGHDVDLLDERPSNGAWARGAVRVAPALLRRRIRKHYESAATTFRTQQYDALLLIKGEVVPEWFLDRFESFNPTAAKIFYTFDSLANSPRRTGVLSKFDIKYTFDPVDANRFRDFKYKPLFYSPEYIPRKQPRDLDISFVGTLHGDRYHLVKVVSSAIPAARKALFLYLPASWYFWLRKLTSKHLRHVRRSEVSTEALSREEAAAIVQRSKAAMDIQRAGQAGLTMRTFEVLATGAALITTNGSIRDAPFYDPHNILIIPRDPALVDALQVAEFVHLQADEGTVPEGFEQYSLEAWANSILNDMTRDGSV